jgi:DNA-binding HxlR family transcriptional regulator
MLTPTPRRLVEDGMVARTAYAEMPPSVEYALTSLGRSLLETATSTATAQVQWASDHKAELRANRARR